jgi:hypothetical protein
MARLRFDAVAGVLIQGIGPADNSIISVGMSRMGNVHDPDTALVVLWAEDGSGNIIRAENLNVVLHDIGSQVAWVDRGVDGSIAQDWPAGTRWRAVIGAADFA